ncbi:MAG: glyoxalase family protein [Acidobacteriota bacterium]|jgi:glyoxalase family protein
MRGVNGLHHITAIAGPAQENLDFYAGILGMRLVKKSVNQDDPGTYHLFYADAEGRPGTDLTFFPWTHMAPPRLGHGMAVEVGLEVPTGSLEYWAKRLERYGAKLDAVELRFAARVLPLVDPHGLRLSLVEGGGAAGRPFTPWEHSPVPPEHQVRGLHSGRLWERDERTTAAFLTNVLGFEQLGIENGWTRYGFPDSPGAVDIREARDARRGSWGVGSVHHLAWRVEDEEHQVFVRSQVESAGADATPVIDRFWFKSVYFKEPGGVLFELATDGPGFATDEDPAHLGETLVLPPWLEPSRERIEAVLPSLEKPDVEHRTPA